MDSLIYIAAFVFALMAIGIYLTALEFQRMERENIDEQGSRKDDAR